MNERLAAFFARLDWPAADPEGRLCSGASCGSSANAGEGEGSVPFA